LKKYAYLFIFILMLIGISACADTTSLLTSTPNETTSDLITTENTSTDLNTSTQNQTTNQETSSYETTSQETTTPQTTTTPTAIQTTQEGQTTIHTEVNTGVTTTEIITTTEVDSTTESTTIHYVTITFENMDFASGTLEITGVAGNEFTMPNNPRRNGYVFDGFYLEDSFDTPFNITVFPENDMTVYAKWIQLISIYFEPLNGSNTTPISMGIPGDTIDFPDDPTRQGYIFEGWYTDQTFTTPFTLTTFPNSNLSVYAKWVEEITAKDEMVTVLEDDFGFTCSNNVCELVESSWLTYTFDLNQLTFTKALLDDDPSGDEQTKNEVVIIDENWDVEYNISITYLSSQTASMRVTGNALSGSYIIRSFSSNYLSESNMYDDALHFIAGDYGAGAVSFLETIFNVAGLSMEDLK